MYYYGYRWYAPNLQRWLNRDPIGEPGFELLRGGKANPWEGILSSGIPAEVSQGPNLYAYVRNNSLNKIDPLGLSVGGPLPGWTGPGKPYHPSCNPFHGPGPSLKCALLAALIPALAAAVVELCTITPTPHGCLAAVTAFGLALDQLNDECATTK